ncbi:MAG: ankyrin repeat domain-containing protein, partial [Nitrospirae bacterium]|nr:ankyrin repeat domain-containing protein [Nitrospirota bacterium]
MKMKGNLISLISVIFILLVGMAMTGCATTGNTPLMSAVGSGDINAVKRLLNEGADVNAKDSDNYSALMVAALDGYTEIVKLLIEKGADIDYAITIMLNKYPWQGGGYEVMERKASAATAVKLLEKFAKKQEIASQPVIAAAKPSQEVSPVIKSDVDELPAVKAKPNK